MQPPQINFEPSKILRPSKPYNHNESFTGSVTSMNIMPWPRNSVKVLASYPIMEYWIDILKKWSSCNQNYIYYNWIDSNGKQLYLNRTKRFDQFTQTEWNEWLKYIDYTTPNLNPTSLLIG